MGMALVSLESDKNKLVESISAIDGALSRLKNKESSYAKEHVILIDTYSKMVDLIDAAIDELTQ